ncbi:hypothetical protein [Mycobacteroides abscessus]|uniref:hypothetical protein n=1 Tax=Mycobacteroides abscessus TaxID=36809 RepID=UPI000D89DB74|nr:hypothetical protein [Mycobacteroides abscessus]SPX87812.1 Uncharacterised protein [Mycobacteroides abscessus]
MQSEGTGAEAEQQQCSGSASGTDGEIDALVAELASLRVSEGLSMRGFANASTLRAVLAASGGHSADNFTAGKAYLEALLTKDDEINTVVAYRNALRLGSITGNGVDNRRNALADLEGCSYDTIKRREKDGIDELVVILRDLAAHASHHDAQPISDTPTDTGSPKTTVLSVVRSSRYDGRYLKEVTIDRKIRAEVDNRQFRTIKFRLPTDPKAITIEALGGCTIESSEWRPDGTLVSKVKLSKILNHGDDPHIYTVRYIVTTDKPCDPRIVYSVPPRSRLNELCMRIQFKGNPLPTSVWWRENRTSMQASSDLPGEPLVLDQGGYVQHTFTNNISGLVQVIAWEWPDE